MGWTEKEQKMKKLIVRLSPAVHRKFKQAYPQGMNAKVVQLIEQDLARTARQKKK